MTNLLIDCLKALPSTFGKKKQINEGIGKELASDLKILEEMSKRIKQKSWLRTTQTYTVQNICSPHVPSVNSEFQ